MKLDQIRQLTGSLATWRQAVAGGEFDPAELAADLGDQLNRFQQKTNSFVTLLPPQQVKAKLESAIKDSTHLSGWPFSVKDIFITQGIRTTASSQVLADYVPNYSSTVYQRADQAGAVLTGKTNSDAWGFGASTENSGFGPVRNPYDLSRVPGGSSGGSAAAVAMGLSAFDIAEDTGGSIRQPAGFCGVIGFKPTYGLISRYGAIAFASSLDTVGVIGRRIEDVVEVLNIIKGPDQQDASINPDQSAITLLPPNKLKGLKVGIMPDLSHKGVARPILTQLKRFYTFLTQQLKAKLVEVKLPHFDYGLSVYYLLAPAEASSNLARYDGIRYGAGRDKFELEAVRRILLGNFALSAGYYDAYYLKALKVRRLIYQDFVKLFKQVDILLLPTSPSTAFKLGEKSLDPLQMYLSDIFTIPPSLAGVPAVSLPAGQDDDGLPIGLQLVAGHFQETLLASLVKVWQEETKFYHLYPPLKL